MRARRRVTRYDSLVSDQLHLCPEHWRYNHDFSAKAQATCPVAHATTPLQHLSRLRDCDQVRIHLAQNKTRISEAIKFVMSLMSVNLNNLVVEQNDTLLNHKNLSLKQNKLSEVRNKSLAFLTGVTSFLLPFTTVAAFMAIPTDSGLGPGSKGQWIYWMSAGVLAPGLMLAFLLYFVHEKHGIDKKGQANLKQGSLLAMLKKPEEHFREVSTNSLSQRIRRVLPKSEPDMHVYISGVSFKLVQISSQYGIIFDQHERYLARCKKKCIIQIRSDD